MENSTVSKGVFLYTKKIESELMVKCLQALLNNLPDINFTSITADESFLGYKVHFCRSDEEAVLEKQQLRISGQNIHVCPLNTCLRIHNISSRGYLLLESEINEAIEKKFGKLLDISHIHGPPGHINENKQSLQIFADIPEIKAVEIFNREGSRELLLPLPDKKLELKITLCCRRCRTDGHVAQECHQVSVGEGRRMSNDGERMFADSTMKIDMNFESVESYAEKIGRDLAMKAGGVSEDQIVEDPGAKEIKKEPEYQGSAGVPSEKLPFIHDDKDNFSNITSDDDIQIISHPANPNSANVQSENFVKKEEKDETENPVEDFYTAESPGPSSKRRRSSKPIINVEDMSVLSDSLQECINEACENSLVISREKLQAFFHHVKKKSNVIEVAKKYTPDEFKLKELLQHISKSYYDTPQGGTKEDKRFIKWLDERIGKFVKKTPQKRKHPSKS